MPELKNYVCHKEVQAKPMLRKEYCAYRGWNLPKDENPEDEGYFVVYASGYESWSPKEEFEQGYSSNNDALDRIIVEKQQLESKLSKLTAALNNPAIVAKIPAKQLPLMQKQEIAMDTYLNLLNERIEFWGVK